MRGRKVWVVAGTLLADAPAPVTRSDGGLSSDLPAWVDQETKLTVREELTVRKTWAKLRPGNRQHHNIGAAGRFGRLRRGMRRRINDYEINPFRFRLLNRGDNAGGVRSDHPRIFMAAPVSPI